MALLFIVYVTGYFARFWFGNGISSLNEIFNPFFILFNNKQFIRYVKCYVDGMKGKRKKKKCFFLFFSNCLNGNRNNARLQYLWCVISGTWQPLNRFGEKLFSMLNAESTELFIWYSRKKSKKCRKKTFYKRMNDE